MKKIITLLILIPSFCMIYSGIFAQNWSVKMQPSRAFIENKGQFPTQNKGLIKCSDVLYAIDDGQAVIYFKPDGIVYAFNKKTPKHSKEKWDEDSRYFKNHAEKEKEERAVITTTDIVSMKWVNANPDVIVIAEEATSDYFSYSYYDASGKIKNINHINGFRKIIYNNLYPNIDVEYVFHPVDGIEYSLVLHPGADISKVKMSYSGVPEIKVNGDLHINTKFGDIIDHSPASFYSDNKSNIIASQFTKNGNTISFNLGSYDKNKILIIDPWTQTPSIANSNGVWECEHDSVGNVYIIGGDMPMKLLKYNSAGTIKWTYFTPYDTANNWLGTLAAEPDGSTYITSGSIAALQKIDTSGGLVWNAPPPFNNTDEYWDITFNCDHTKMFIGGTTQVSGLMNYLKGAIYNINTTNGNINDSIIVGNSNMSGFPPIVEEVRSITSAGNGNLYFLTMDTVGLINQNFSSNTLFEINSNYSLAYKCENFRPNNGNGGIKAIKANNNFVYTLNGTSIQKRSFNNLSILDTAVIHGGISLTVSFGKHQLGNCGIDIDNCGNVYVGSGDRILKYDANLNVLDSVMLPYHVYDIAVSTNGNVIVCGATGNNSITNRTGYVQSVYFPACIPIIPSCCDNSIVPVGTVCSSSPISLVAGTPGGIWGGEGITDTIAGIFDPSAVPNLGTFTITYTLSCGSSSIPITVNPPLNGNAGPDQSVCYGSVIQLNASGGNAYHWSPSTGLTATNINNPFASPLQTTIYTVTIDDLNGCSGNYTITVFVQQVYQDQEICIVTVDSLTQKNKVIWDKTPDVGTASYNIYKEVALNTYDLIGNSLYSDPGYFIDMTSVPETHADKYKISVVDTCNAESSLSPYHKTINLVVSVYGTTMGLSWSAYEDASGNFIPLKYYIFRGTQQNNLQLYDSISSSFLTYNDNNITSLFYYKIGVKRTPACNGTKTNVLYSFSNIRNNGLIGIDELNENSLLQIFPNPFNKTTTIEFPNPSNSKFLLTISDVTGKIVREENINVGKIELNCETLESGIYFIELKGEKNFRGKLLLE